MALVLYKPPSLQPDDGSGSGSTPSNYQGLVNELENSTEEGRDSNWWNNAFNSIKSFFQNIGDHIKYRYNEWAHKYDSSPGFSSSNPNYQYRDNDNDMTSINNALDVFKSVYDMYNADYQKSADKYNKWQEELYKNYWKDQMKGLEAAGINPLLMLNALSSPSIPSGQLDRISTYTPGSTLSTYASILGSNKQAGTNLLGSILKIIAMLAAA